jgi:hypothetical protein
MERIHGQARHRVGFRRAPSRSAGPGRRRAARWWSRPPRMWTVPTTAGRTTPSSAREAPGKAAGSSASVTRPTGGVAGLGVAVHVHAAVGLGRRRRVLRVDGVQRLHVLLHPLLLRNTTIGWALRWIELSLASRRARIRPRNLAYGCARTH